MAKYRDFDDDYIYDEDENIYHRNRNTVRNEKQNISEDRRKSPLSSGKSAKPSHNRKKKKKKMKTWVMALLFAGELLFLIILLVVWYAVDKMNMIEYNPIDRGSIAINDEEFSDDTQQILDGYTNILLLGSDSRENTSESLIQAEENHTDSIIVASINNKTKEVRLVSIYRDTILKIVDTAGVKSKGSSLITTYDKATEAMFYFGVEAAISMVNTNLDLDITDYIMVNWSALIDIIDAVGGIDIDINLIEQRWLNRYLVDTSKNTGKSYEEVDAIYDDGSLTDDQAAKKKDTVSVHLDGIQATAYCRIRYGGGDDYRRTERQRMVIGLVVEKAKHMDITKLNDAINSIAGNIATSFDVTELLTMAKSLTSYTITESTGFPFEVTTSIKKSIIMDYPKSGFKVSDPVVPVNLAANVSELHKFLFDLQDYDPTKTVKTISETITSLTGVE